MSESLIERAERETGKRWDDPSGDTLAILFGAVAREMGKSHHQERDDFAAGLLIQHQITPEYARQQQSDAMIADLLLSGFSPDALGAISKALKGKFCSRFVYMG